MNTRPYNIQSSNQSDIGARLVSSRLKLTVTQHGMSAQPHVLGAIMAEAADLTGKAADLTGKAADLTGKAADLTGKAADLTGKAA
jgi:hypothetical protein